jgi:hypothetical protein
MGGSEVAVGQAFLEDRPAVLRCRSMRSDCLYSSSQPKFSHFRPSKMEWTEASVLRSTSVSSSRRIMVPPLWRAYSQLKIKVRALPTWRNPVGEGAKRTRGFNEDVDSSGKGFGLNLMVWMRAVENYRQASPRCEPRLNPTRYRSSQTSQGTVLKSCCAHTAAVKTLAVDPPEGLGESFLGTPTSEVFLRKPSSAS